MYVLVLFLYWRMSTNITTIQSFSSLAACQQAGEDYRDHASDSPWAQSREYVCLKK